MTFCGYAFLLSKNTIKKDILAELDNFFKKYYLYYYTLCN